MPKISPSLTYVSPSLTKSGKLNGHKTGGGLVYVNPHNSNNSNNKGNKKKKKKIEAIRGKEVTVRDSAAPAQVIYGIMRVGGITTMIHTSSLSAAYLQTGDQSSNNALLWSAATVGDTGNSLSVELFNPGPSNPTTTCTLIGGVHVKITLATNGGGVVTSTLNQTIGALQADAASYAVMRCQKSFAGTNGVVTALAQTSLQYGGGEYLHQIITLAGHEIDSVMALYFDGRGVEFGASPDTRWSTGYFTDSGGSLVFMAINYGADDQIAQPDAVAQIPDVWTTNHKQSGCAHVYILMRYSKSVFAEGLPEIEFLIKGKKVYDPRTGQTAFTDSFGSVIGQNAALIANDYLTNTRFGLGCTTVDATALIAAADACDENIPRSTLPDEKRYAFNSSFDPTEGADDILSQMEQGMAGKIFSRDGKVFIYPGVYRAPTITYTLDDLRGDIRINQTHVPRSERFNFARGTFTSDVDFQETDIPFQKNDAYATEDGGVIYEDFPINFVTSPTQCQRILKIELEKVRQGIQVSVPLKLSGLLVNVGDTVNLTLSRYGWTPKIFEVMNLEIVVEDDGVIGVDLELRETASGVFDWNSGMETATDTAPNTTLPSATDVGEPTAVTAESGTNHLYLRGDGMVQSRIKVMWTAPAITFITSGGGFYIRHKKTTDSSWITTVQEPGESSFHYILDVQDGFIYDIEIAAFNTIGFLSDWVAITHLVVGKTEKPLDVTDFVANISNLGIICTWARSNELDLRGYRIKRATTNVWAAGTVVENLTTTTQFQDNFRTTGVWYYMVKAVDTSGNESTNHAFFLVTVNSPLAVATLDIRVTNNVILIDWEVPASTSFPIVKYRLYKGDTFAGATLLGEAFVTFQAYTEQFAGTGTFWVTAVDTGDNEGPETGKRVTWYSPPNTIQYVYNAIDADESELASAIFDEVYPNSFIAPVVIGDSWSQHFSRNGWDKFLDQMVGYDSDVIKAISGLTCWFSANAEVTVDSNNAVSQIDDLKNTNHATQGTAANRPLLSRADNQGNMFINSHSLATWLPISGTNVTSSGETLTASAGNTIHQVHWRTSTYATGLIVIGQTYRQIFKIKYINHQYAWVGDGSDAVFHGARINLSAGTIDATYNLVSSSISTDSDGYLLVRVTYTRVNATGNGTGYVCFGSSTIANPATSYNAAGTEQIGIAGISNAVSTWDDTLLTTTTYPLYSGINGNRALVFDGSNDSLQNTYLPSIASGYTICTVIKPYLLHTGMIVSCYTASAQARFLFYIESTGRVTFAVYNGSTNSIQTTSNTSQYAANTSYVLTCTYDGGTAASGLKIFLNGTQIDFTDSTTGAYTVPGATTKTFEIGADTAGANNKFNGYIPEVLVFESELSSLNRGLVEAYLAKFTSGTYAELEPFIGSDAGWIDEFTARSWTTLQDKIDDGFTIWIEPSDLDTAYFTRIVDTGVIIAGARIEVTFSETILDGSVTTTTYIETSLDLITWTAYAEGRQALASNFRFVKVQLQINGADEMSLVRIGNPAISVGIRQLTITGRTTTSAGGTVTVSIGSSFLSLDSIQLTPSGGTGKEVFPVFTYSTLNPTSFDVLGYSGGAPAAVDFTWTVIGATGVL